MVAGVVRSLKARVAEHARVVDLAGAAVPAYVAALELVATRAFTT
jgi:hypothetical protein